MGISALEETKQNRKTRHEKVSLKNVLLKLVVGKSLSEKV